jgi:hypothetical protein
MFFFVSLSLFLCAGSAGALDFGLALNQSGKISNEVSAPQSGDAVLFYNPVASPWVSASLGKSFNLYLSGRIGFEYSRDLEGNSAWRDPMVLPELDRSELAWMASPFLHFHLGRQRFQDPSGLAAAGLFDGLNVSFSAGGSRFSLGAWYTGFLYKNTANIIITQRDRGAYEKPLALDEGYFASRRGMFSFEWEKPALGPRSSLALGLLGQFDLNEGDDRLHSQYFSFRYGLRPVRGFDIQVDGVLGAGEVPGQTAFFPESLETVFFAGGLGFDWTPPGALDDRLSLRGLYSSPSWDRFGSFIPVNSVPRGQVFSPALVGLSTLRGAYTLRPRPSLSLTGEASYFIRTDTVTFQDNREPEKLNREGYFLGMECYGTMQWTPLPDLALTLGGGAFFPQLGNAFEEAAVRWKAALGLILSL